MEYILNSLDRAFSERASPARNVLFAVDAKDAQNLNEVTKDSTVQAMCS
jgi:hypothetical protein